MKSAYRENEKPARLFGQLLFFSTAISSWECVWSGLWPHHVNDTVLLVVFVCVVGTLAACKTPICHDEDSVLKVSCVLAGHSSHTPPDFRLCNFWSDSLPAAALGPVPTVSL